jgi:dolichyl-phosphate-mannose-protein mannosyltransferase
MPARAVRDRDPFWWCAIVVMVFALIAAWHLGTPSRIYFDEVHYVKAARKLLALEPFNREHPLFAKELIAASIHWLGDRPVAWRLPSLALGTLGLFAFSRLVWLTSGRAPATIAATLLLATSFLWFVLSRIAMLDMISAGLGMSALWLFASAMHRQAGAARWRLALAGLCMGLSLGAKWSFAPALALPGLLLLAMRLKDRGIRFLAAKGKGPMPGISLVEAGFWIGLFPLAIYWLTFGPEFFYAERTTGPLQFVTRHQDILRLQDSVVKPHTYQSRWYQWVADWRSIWFLYDDVDGAQRGIVALGNPFTMWAGLLALPWALFVGLFRKRGDALVFLTLYAVTLGVWAINGKPVQFYYHYLLPSAFLCACFALLLDDLSRRKDRWRRAMPVSLVAATAMFAYFYPILSADSLAHKRSFEIWMWLPSWR